MHSGGTPQRGPSRLSPPFTPFFRGSGESFRALSERRLLWLAIVLAIFSWLPACTYVVLDSSGNAWKATSITLGGFWLNALRFNPLSWGPQFLAGMVLGRLFALRVDRGGMAFGSASKNLSGRHSGGRADFCTRLRARDSLCVASARHAGSVYPCHNR